MLSMLLRLLVRSLIVILDQDKDLISFVTIKVMGCKGNFILKLRVYELIWHSFDIVIEVLDKI